MNILLGKKNSSVADRALILSCLNSLSKTPKLEKIQEQIFNFLLSQKDNHWIFNQNYSDTFLSLIAIQQYNPKVLNGSALAKIVTGLTSLEIKEGGPYCDFEKKIDIALNANIAFFLALHGVFIPNLHKFLIKKIERNDFASKYFPSDFLIIYFLSRYLNLKKKSVKIKKKLENIIILRLKKTTEPIPTALSISSLIKLKSDPKNFDNYIKNITSKNPFCQEALALLNQKKSKKDNPKKNPDMKKIYLKVIKYAEKKFSSLDADLKKIALKTLGKTIKKDKDRQIILMPYFFYLSLKKQKKRIPLDFFISLGIANLYGWIAYTIYDDFLDNEGQSSLLPLANICLRELTSIFIHILPESDFENLFHQIMDILENTNSWEVAHCRFNPKNFPPANLPDYSDLSPLANRSLGHALGPIAILVYLGYSKNSKEIAEFLKFFRHFLIARQLNDDIHDWQKDFKMGNINYVGAKLLKKYPEESKISVLREKFWLESFDEISNLILNQTTKAKNILKTNQIFTKNSLLDKLINSIEKSTKLGKHEQRESVKFLKAYG